MEVVIDRTPSRFRYQSPPSKVHGRVQGFFVPCQDCQGGSPGYGVLEISYGRLGGWAGRLGGQTKRLGVIGV